MSVELDLTEDEARFIWCRLQRARDGMVAAISEGKADRAVWLFGYMDEALHRLKEAAPASVAPTGNETNKPPNNNES